MLLGVGSLEFHIEKLCADSQDKVPKVNSYWELLIGSYFALGATTEDMASFLDQPKKIKFVITYQINKLYFYIKMYSDFHIRMLITQNF